MKIVFLHHANIYRAGIERMMAIKANMLAEQMGWEVVLLTYEQNAALFPYPLSSKVKCVDLNIHFYDAYKSVYPMRYFRKLILRRRLAEVLRRFLQEQRPDIVICTDKDAHELNALSHARTTEIIVVEAHTGMIDHEMQVRRTHSFIRRQIAYKDMMRLKRAVSRYDVLIALTASDARCWSSYVKTEVIPNCLSHDLGTMADLSKEKKRVIMVGRVDYQKGQDLLSQAWLQVSQRHPDWRLDLYGDGETTYVSEVKPLIDRQFSIVLHPSTPDIFTEYQKSDFLVCSSRWEAFGLILIEAMSCGLPVVAFDCDNGPRSIITDGEDGLLVKNGDVNALAEKICWMIEHPLKRQQMGQIAWQHVASYCRETIIQRYVSFLSSLLA